MSLILKNALVARLTPPSVERADLRVERGVIVSRGKSLRPRHGDTVRDLGGALVLPGNVCAHTHLYSSLSRGMPAPARAPRSFVEILQRVWWKLDCALDEEAVYYSALAGAIDALRSGTTTLIDHHASPNAIPGSLDLIKRALAEVGLRGILCYETTDRGGMQRRDAGLEENDRFVRENMHARMFRGTIGAHASFTLSEGSLRELARLSGQHACGVHIHVAESEADIRAFGGTDILRRLTGILSPKTIFAHGVHLSKRQLSAAAAEGVWLVHNPRSNMNNGVGYAPLPWFGPRAALGTDGFQADMFAEAALGFFRSRDSRHPVSFDRLPAMLQAGQDLVSTFFGERFGLLDAGSPADLIALDYSPPTPLTSGNLLGHLLFGTSSRMVTDVMIDGRWVMRNRELKFVDEQKIMREAARVARRLWKKLK
jgi:putative selenium metabolism protein SsnA